MNTDLRGMNIVVFDLEIKEPIVGEVTWERKDLMGISVGVLYDFMTDEFKVYMDDNLAELSNRIHTADLVSGFNIIDFDVPLLNATLAPHGVQPIQPKIYDPLYWHRQVLGGNKFTKGLKLDDHLLGTFGKEHMKSGNGADAPIWWKQGKLGRLISYCIDDVKRETKLFSHIWQGKPVITPLNGSNILKSPYEVLCELNPGKYPDRLPFVGIDPGFSPPATAIGNLSMETFDNGPMFRPGDQWRD